MLNGNGGHKRWVVGVDFLVHSALLFTRSTLCCYLPPGSNQVQDGSAAEHVLRCYGTEHCFAPLSDPGQPERWVVHNNFGVT